MDLSVRTEGPWYPEDRSWLGSADGTLATRSITLDVSAFTAGTHYPLGYIPSGTVLGPITSSGLYGPYSAGTNEIQTATVTGSPTGGTFTLSFDGATTGAIAYNAAASAVQSALEALPNVTAGDVTVTGSAGGPYTVTFSGNLGGTNVAAMTASGASLTGGTSPGVTIATQTAGGSTASDGTEVAAGFLFSSTKVVSGGADVGAALLERGVIRVSKLPSASGLDTAARADLRNHFIFRP